MTRLSDAHPMPAHGCGDLVRSNRDRPVEPIRVLHCIFSTGIGGLEAGVVKLVNSIATPDIEQAICAFSRPPGQGAGASIFDQVTNPRCRLFQLERRRGNDPRMIRQLVGVVRDFRPTVVHTRSWGTYLEGALAATLNRTPVLIHGEHGTPSPGRWRHRWAYRLLARRTRVVITVSEALAGLYHETCRSWATEVCTIYNGVDTRRYTPAVDPAEAKAALGLPASAVVVGSVGRLAPVKGFDVLLRSMTRVASEVPEALLLLVGDGPERDALAAAAERFGITDRVRFVGHRSDVIPYYQAMDVYVNSSHSEGLSNSILEALACGVPVVATAVGGNPEVLRHAGCGGVLVPPGDPGALADALARYLRDDVGRPLYSQAARQTIVDHFGLERMVGRYEALYREAALS
jgi:sugar transferase (PEP-CTERM/EpsH1 system associated)